jgi:anion-transporting  ArsA/GET3 family ATPase
VVVSAAEPDALREASFFVDRLSQEGMPLAGLVLNRTHPMLCSLPVERAIEATDKVGADSADPGAASLVAAVLQIHSDRAQTAKREIRLLSRFTGANPHVPIVGVPSLPFDVSDLEALRALADQITSA